MKKRRPIIISFTVSLALGVTAYGLYHLSAVMLRKPALPPKPPAFTTLQAPHGQQDTGRLEGPPPSAPINAPTYPPHPEPSLTLIGATSEQLRQIEQYLPEGTRIVTYPVSETEQRAAYANVDLKGDGNTETVVVYKGSGPEAEGGDAPLVLGVLVKDGNSLSLRSSARLHGALIYGNIYDKHAPQFAVRELTGDGHPCIIVASGVGASLGGALQVYSYDGSSLRQLADIDGHTFRVYDGRAGRVSEITAQSRYEDKPRAYQWNGKTFEQINATTGKR
jgi:hypothetical protein